MDRLKIWVRLATERSTARRAVTTSLIVGSILAVINHGADLMARRLDTAAVLQIALTFAVPYAVATISSIAAIRGHRHEPLLELEVEAIRAFPARNPNAVLRMSGDGRLTYANAASAPISRALNLGVGEALPTDIRHRFQRALLGTTPEPIEVIAAGRTYRLKLVAVPEFDFVNIYGSDVSDPDPVRVATPDQPSATGRGVL